MRRSSSARLAPAHTLFACGGARLLRLGLWCRPDLLTDRDRELGWTPLLSAAFNGDAALVEAIVALGADVNVTDSLGQTPVHFGAGSRNNTRILEILLDAGAEVPLLTIELETPLHYAARLGRRACVEFLLTHGCSRAINLTNIEDETALDQAMESGNDTTVRLLEEHGAVAGTAVVAKLDELIAAGAPKEEVLRVAGPVSDWPR